MERLASEKSKILNGIARLLEVEGDTEFNDKAKNAAAGYYARKQEEAEIHKLVKALHYIENPQSAFPNIAIAEANREHLEKQYQQIISEAEVESYLSRLNGFVAHIKTAKRVSINKGVFQMPEWNQKKALIEKVQQEIQRTQEVMEKLSRLNVSETEQKRIQKLRERLEQLVKKYEVLENAE